MRLMFQGPSGTMASVAETPTIMPRASGPSVASKGQCKGLEAEVWRQRLAWYAHAHYGEAIEPPLFRFAHAAFTPAASTF